MIINFFKFTSEGNVYVVLDNRGNQISLTADKAELLCDYCYGVGGDGVLVLEQENDFLKMGFFPISEEVNGEADEPDLKALCCLARFASVFQEDMMAPLTFNSPWGKVRADFMEGLVSISLIVNCSGKEGASDCFEANYILEGSIEVGE